MTGQDYVLDVTFTKIKHNYKLFNMTITHLITAVRDLCDSDSTSMPMAAVTDAAVIWLNESYKQVIGWIINSDGTWQWDDTNQTDEPRGKGTLVEAQVDYTFSSDYLQIEAMDVLGLDAQWKRLKPYDQSEVGMSPEEYFGTDSSGNILTGLPEYYDLFSDDSFRIYPAPSATYCTLASGLRVWFKRNPVTFIAAEISTGTKEPGFSLNHKILAYMTALPYCMKYKKDRIPLYEKKVMDMKQEIINHYSKREREKRKQITLNSTPWR